MREGPYFCYVGYGSHNMSYMASEPDKPNQVLRVISGVFLGVGAISLGLALSTWNYIQWVWKHGYKVDSSSTGECIVEVALGVVSCSVGLLLWYRSKRPAI